MGRVISHYAQNGWEIRPAVNTGREIVLERTAVYRLTAAAWRVSTCSPGAPIVCEIFGTLHVYRSMSVIREVLIA
jgi:hypothetical protein